MARHGKRYEDARQSLDREREYPPDEAISLVKQLSRVKFNDEPSQETFDANAQWAFDLGIAKEKPNLATLVDLTVLKKLQAAK